MCQQNDAQMSISPLKTPYLLMKFGKLLFEYADTDGDDDDDCGGGGGGGGG
ncbi:unnamed protein product, partial [Hymenolepis diminuta]|uniref:Uncharacterized protein n=1 Tax=Hymenolepis diminuta TaxID=6216 RepID=A0A0R3SZD6_HYMDI